MSVLRFSARADATGVIRLEIPVGSRGEYDLEVAVSPKPPTHHRTPEELGWPPGYFENVFDSISDPAFERGDQGELKDTESVE